MIRVDLHSHSVFSDGALEPVELAQRIAVTGIRLWALTDHDTTDGLVQAAAASRATGVRWVTGVEISASWASRTLHVLGLNIDPEAPALRTGLARLREMREQRAATIGAKLAKHGWDTALLAARQRAGAGTITRTHFAEALVELGAVHNLQQAFDRYLGRGKPAHVQAEWLHLTSVIKIITAAGGSAVLAHPMRYDLTATWLRKLLSEFKLAGGHGIEVASGPTANDQLDLLADYAVKFELKASTGSDFHSPTHPWRKLGGTPELPKKLIPIWADWGLDV